MVGGGGFGWEPGEWTDDTSMAVAIAEVAATGADLRQEEALDSLVRRTMNRWFYKARSGAKRDDLRWHDLRHSGAVLAAATGATLAELMARLGHSTPQAAMRYQHAAQGRDRQIARLLAKLVMPAPQPTE